MNRPIVTDEEVERALDWLRDNASEIGQAKAGAILTAHLVKHTKALIMMERTEMPVSAQEREAMADPRYLKAIEKEAIAAGEYEEMKSLREAAALKIEAWRSASANFRAMKI